MNLQPYHDIIRDVANAPESVWHRISKDWYNSLLSEAEKLSIPKTCETCKHWKRSERTIWQDKPYPFPEEANAHLPCLEYPGAFLLEKGYPLHGECSNPNFVVEMIPLKEDQISIDPNDGCGNSGVFLTGEKFGCIHHEPK